MAELMLVCGLRRHKDDFPSSMLMESGNSKMISEQGIEWIKENIKNGRPRQQ